MSDSGEFRVLRTWRDPAVIGTDEYPIVCRGQNGDLRRITMPERPQQLPTYLFWDGTLNHRQQEVVVEAMTELYSSIGLDQTKITNYGNWRSASYRLNNGSLSPHQSVQWAIEKNYNHQRRQINASNLVNNMYIDPYQKTHPHWEVILTNYDLYTEGCNFCVGIAQPDLGTLISLSRFKGFEVTDLGREVIKTEIFHEVGHVLGLPSTRRGVNNLEDALGYHCKIDGCSMKQGMSVPNDWINNTRMRIIQNKGPFCQDCIKDLGPKIRHKR